MTAAPVRVAAGAAAFEHEEPTPLARGGPNAIARALAIVGDEWNLQLLRRAVLGARRYRDFAAALPISDAVLSDRLAGLVADELLRRVPADDGKEGLAYELTLRGRTTWPVLVAIWTWEQDWVDHVDGLPQFVHAACGQPSSADLACGACRRAVGIGRYRASLGPSGDWPRSVPDSDHRRRRPRGEFVETMELLGNHWSAVVIGAAQLGVHRFGEFRAALGIPPSTLSDRLARFVERGVVVRRSDGYRLTSKGWAFAPVTVAAIAWGQRWWRAPEGPALLLEHDGHEMPVRLACRSCSQLLRAVDVRVQSPE